MRLKHWVLAAGAAVFIGAWIAVATGLVLGVDRRAWTALVVVAAFASEGFIWCIAAALGLSVFEARRKIWRVLTRPFR